MPSELVTEGTIELSKQGLAGFLVGFLLLIGFFAWLAYRFVVGMGKAKHKQNSEIIEFMDKNEKRHIESVNKLTQTLENHFGHVEEELRRSNENHITSRSVMEKILMLIEKKINGK